jgi:hypothetical protein
MAIHCRDHLTALGWTAAILIDPTEWETPPQGTVAARYAPARRMVGNACHEAIIAAMAAMGSDGDILLKTDCDTRLSPALSAWLMDRAAGAGTVLLGKALWGGLWAAPWRQVAELGAIAPTIRRCRCPESHLAVCGLRAHGGIAAHPLPAAVWRCGTPWPPGASALTLPRRCQSISRAVAGEELFAMAGGD